MKIDIIGAYSQISIQGLRLIKHLAVSCESLHDEYYIPLFKHETLKNEVLCLLVSNKPGYFFFAENLFGPMREARTIYQTYMRVKS